MTLNQFLMKEISPQPHQFLCKLINAFNYRSGVKSNIYTCFSFLHFYTRYSVLLKNLNFILMKTGLNFDDHKFVECFFVEQPIIFVKYKFSLCGFCVAKHLEFC